MIRGQLYVGDLLLTLDPGASLDYTKQAIREAGDFLRAEWIRVSTEFRDTGRYMLGIQNPEPLADGLGVEIVNTAPHAAAVEDGHPSFHLPTAINWGAAARVKFTARGVAYLTIPFRHFAPAGPASGPTRTALRQMMPEDIYNRARRLAPSVRLPTSGPRPRYSWGGRLNIAGSARWWQPTQHVNRAGVDVVGMKKTWTAPKWEGMVRFQQSNPSTGSRGSTYLTFRTLMSNAPGWQWVIPAVEGKHVIDRVLTAENIEAVRQRVADGVARDLLVFEGAGL